MIEQTKSFTVILRDGSEVHYFADEPVSIDILEEITSFMESVHEQVN